MTHNFIDIFRQLRGFPHNSDSKESTLSARDMSLIPGSGRSLEKEMATNSSILAWKILWKRSLVGCSPWGHNESGTTEQVTLMTCDPFSLAFNHVMVSKSNLDSKKELYMLNLINCALIYWYNIPVNFLSFINKFLKNTVVFMHYKAKELVLSNCGAGEDSWEFLGLQGN